MRAEERVHALGREFRLPTDVAAEEPMGGTILKPRVLALLLLGTSRRCRPGNHTMVDRGAETSPSASVWSGAPATRVAPSGCAQGDGRGHTRRRANPRLSNPCIFRWSKLHRGRWHFHDVEDGPDMDPSRVDVGFRRLDCQ